MPRYRIGRRVRALYPRKRGRKFSKYYRATASKRRRVGWRRKGFVRAVRKAVHHVPRHIVTRVPVLKKMCVVTHKMQDAQYYIFQYGRGHNDKHADYFRPIDMWSGRSDAVKGLQKNYYKVAISRITTYFKNFSLSEYAVKYKDKLDKSNKIVNTDSKKLPKLAHFMNLKADSDVLVDINNEFDSTRRLVYFKDNSGLDSNLVGLFLNTF